MQHNINVENKFLRKLLNNTVQIYLTNGIKLIGTLINGDDFTILLDGKGGQEQLIYKNAIASLSLASHHSTGN